MKCIRKNCVKERNHGQIHIYKNGMMSHYNKLELKILGLEQKIKYIPNEIKDKQRSISHWETQIRIANHHIKNRKLDVKNLKIKTKELGSQLKKELRKA